MYSLEFLVTTLIVVASPGTGVVYTLAAGLGRGARASVVAAFGCTLGIVPHLAAAMMGLAALLHASAVAFAVVKYAGVAYLLYMAWKTLGEKGALDVAAARSGRSDLAVIVDGIVVNLLNPKLSLFFVAFLPQFLDLSRPMLPQMVIFEATFLVLATLNAFSYALLASAARKTIRNPTVQKVVNRTGGTLLIGAGLLTAGLKRAAA